MQKHYKKAPITEAIVDLRVTLPEDFTVDKFNDIYLRVKDRFPIKSAFAELFTDCVSAQNDLL